MLDSAIEIAANSGTDLVVVHVLAAMRGAVTVSPTAAGALALTSEELADRCHIDCELALAGSDLPWSFEIRAGGPAAELSAAARAYGARCVVVGRRPHRTTLGRYRCVATRLAETCERPVVIVPLWTPSEERFDEATGNP